jgi:predicted Zn-dependent peptidase
VTQTYLEFDTFQKTTLDNGIRVVTEKIPFVQSVAMGVWVRAGSRFEIPPLNGICHFIEHMLFKGTAKRSAYSIACEIDSVGGALNAFTSKELTSFYCRVLSEHLPIAVDLLSDIFMNASFPQEEIEREKQVICQEIHQMEDSPEDLIHELLGMKFWLDDPLGQPILGTIPNVIGLERDTIINFKRTNYSPEETLICAAGNVEHALFVDLVSEQMACLPTANNQPAHNKAAGVFPSTHIENKDLEQVHICACTCGPSYVDESRHAGYILNSILGGGMSSRLFQEVREKRGLAYSVYSFLSSFSDTGMLGIYAGCEPERLEELLHIVGDCALKLGESITDAEVQTAKNQIKGNLILAMESMDSRMNRLAKGEYYFGRFLSMEEMIQAINNVTMEEIIDFAGKTLNSDNYTLVALGPVQDDFDLKGSFSG